MLYFIFAFHREVKATKAAAALHGVTTKHKLFSSVACRVADWVERVPGHRVVFFAARWGEGRRGCLLPH